jgi:hypothetical protein
MGALLSSESISLSDNINDIFKKCKVSFMVLLPIIRLLSKCLVVMNSCLAVWVEHGDELSLEYAGSYALKGDLVRYSSIYCLFF